MVDANQVWDVDQAIEWMHAPGAVPPVVDRGADEPRRRPRACADRPRHGRHGIGVATGEHCHNRVIFKQLFQAEAIGFAQIDTCRLGGVNEVLAVLLLAAKFGVPVCPHAGGVGLCEYVQHLAIFDYIAVSGRWTVGSSSTSTTSTSTSSTRHWFDAATMRPPVHPAKHHDGGFHARGFLLSAGTRMVVRTEGGNPMTWPRVRTRHGGNGMHRCVDGAGLVGRESRSSPSIVRPIRDGSTRDESGRCGQDKARDRRPRRHRRRRGDRPVGVHHSDHPSWGPSASLLQGGSSSGRHRERTGQVNVFEAARRCGIEQVMYTVSIADYGDPMSHYGVFKLANEATRRRIGPTLGSPASGCDR